MRLFSIILLLLITVANYAQQRPHWENPEVFAVNKEKTRTTAYSYPSRDLAIADDFSKSPFFMSLNGDWKFHWVPKVADVPLEFYAENFNDSAWKTISVPGNWELNGYGTPMYINSGYAFPKNPPFIDREDSPTGVYRQYFNLPENWDERKVFIHFEGGTNSMNLWINGKKVGYTENSKSPAEFDITPYIRQGKNLLACEVHKYSDGSYLEDQDMWRLGGINRNVYLYTAAQTRIQDFFAHPDLDKNYKNGLFSVEVSIKNYLPDEVKNRVIEVHLLDKNGKSIFSKSQKIDIPADSSKEVSFSGIISFPLKWTAETPNLYTMLIALKDAMGNVQEYSSHKIGFRKIEVRDGQVFINGKKVFFKGVNLHEFNAYTGQVVSKEDMIRNIRLMKELNINAVRTSHYPQPPLWYKLCDEYGLYLVNENNIESHGLGWGRENVGYSPEWYNAHMDRIYSLVERDKNHPSVIFWSLGNESCNASVFFDMYDWIKNRDASRLVQYETAGRERNTDIICPMYPSWQSMQEDAVTDLGRPYVVCEYAHAMGNSMGNFQEYWDLMRSSKNMQGGFIWEWYNHGFKATDEQGRVYWAYGGDLGGYNKKNDGNFCMDGIISPDRNYLPHTHIVKKVYQNILFEAKDLELRIITVINDFKFTNLSPKNYTYRWVLLRNGEPFSEGKFDVEIPPDSRKDIRLPLPKLSFDSGTEYFLQVYAYTVEDTELIKSGFEVAKEEVSFKGNNYFTENRSEKKTSLVVEKKENQTSINAGDRLYEFSTQGNNTLIDFTYDGKKLFKTLPRLNFWRALTDNDYGSNAQYDLQLWNAAGHNMICSYKGMKQTEDAVTISYTMRPRGIDFEVDLVYSVNSNGSLTIFAAYRTESDDLPEMMRLGMIMSLENEYNNFSWYGRGPHENYVDRNADTFMGIWNSTVEKQAHKYYRPQETGNKTDVRWLSLTNEENFGVKIVGAQPLSVSAINNYPEDLDAGITKKQQHPSDILPRKETVLCVDLFQRGVGGIDSWMSPPFDNYRFKNKNYQYTYTIDVIK